MQFIDNGPDIPEVLLDAHEEGHTVFFCGSGISRAAGLPCFKGLVDKIYYQLGTECNELEIDAYERGQYDMVLHLLEQRIPGQKVGGCPDRC